MTEAEQEAERLIEANQRLARAIGMEFIPDSEKVRAFLKGYPGVQRRAREAVRYSLTLLSDP